MINFEIVAKLKAMKDGEKFKAFEIKDFSSGWQNTRYRFNAITDNSRFQMDISGGKWTDDKKNKIITMKKAEPGKKASKFEVKCARPLLSIQSLTLYHRKPTEFPASHTPTHLTDHNKTYTWFPWNL